MKKCDYFSKKVLKNGKHHCSVERSILHLENTVKLTLKFGKKKEMSASTVDILIKNNWI